MTTEHYVATVDERVLDLMGNAEEWTPTQLAEALAVSKRRVNGALLALESNGDVHVVGKAGRGNPIYKRGPAPRRIASTGAAAKPNKSSVSTWPALDPAIPMAFYAMAAVGRANSRGR
jgi:hypothetical protein